jgi:hypothetical protein
LKSSVRILAIALALAFLLLARTAFQDSPASAEHDDDHIDLDDGEATFADPLDGTIEANYLGFGETATKTVYFYIKSEDLATQVTARTSFTDGSEDTTPWTVATGDVYTLRGDNIIPAIVNDVGQTNAADPTGTGSNPVASTGVVTAFDTAYCADRGAITAAYSEDGNLGEDATTTIDVPSAWGLLSTSTGTNAGECSAPGDDGLPVDDRMLVATTTADTDDDGTPITGADEQRGAARTRLATAAIAAANMAQVEQTKLDNHLIYTYKSGSDYVGSTSTTPALLYTAVHDGTNDAGATVHGAIGDDGLKPLDSVSFKQTYTDGDNTSPTTADVTTPTYVTSADRGIFRLAFTPEGPTTAITTLESTQVTLTYDIQDVYQAKDTTATGADYPAYTSGYSRAWVSSGSDSGQWVDISEVKAYTNNEDLEDDGSPTSNLFQGMVTIVNDTSLETDDVIYAQDGDTLTLQVFDENGNRSSDVLASATALIDDSPPTISDLSPADDSIISDDELRISFSVNDDGAGSDFRNIEDVVTMVQVEKRADKGDEPRSTGTVCPLASGEDDIDNAGGNASRVGVLVAPANAKFSSRCGDIVKTGDGGKFNLIITAQDLAGNVTEHTTQLTIDTAKPTVVGNPGVGQAWDEDKNKAKSSANSILIEFGESLDVDTVAAADFTVAGYTIDSVEVVGTNDDDNKNLNKFVVLTLTEDLANNARPSVTVSSVSDVAGNAIQTATRTSDNKIAAAITVVPFSALIAKDGEQAISLTSDEALRSAGGDYKTQASVNGNLTGLAIKVAADTMGGSGTFKQKTFDDSGAYGVILRAVDLNGNKTDAGAMSVSDEAVKLDLDNDLVAGDNVNVKLKNWPPADSNLNGSFQGEVVAKVNDKEVASSTDTVHFDGADAGKVQLVVGAGVTIKKDATLSLSYKYVTADQVIQVDVDEPTMTSIPADNAETDYAAGAVQFIWTEDKEYAGDTYEKVTLNEASHEGPNGTSTDILDMLTTHDNKTWVYRPAADLALGDHEFTLKATDAAGNSNEVSVTITVIERKPVKINLSPGWNLISLPGMPASADVNDVFSSDTVSVVSQYDGRRVSPWTVWTRGEDGSLSSSPAGRTTIDSGLGLWVLSSDGSPLEVDIPGTSQDNPAAVPPSVELIPGWNLIAVIILDRDTKSVIVDDYLPEGVWSRAFKLDNTTGGFTAISPAPKDEDGEISVNAGQALWVYATQAGVVTPSK